MFNFIVILMFPIPFFIYLYLKKKRSKYEKIERNEVESILTIEPIKKVSDQLTENFHISEFKCYDGTEVPSEFRSNVHKLAQNLQVLREHYNKPITIVSGYRTKSHNDSLVGSAKKSQHLVAKAADFKIKGHSPKEVQETIKTLIKEGKMKEGGLGMYYSFTHYDIRNNKSRWYG